MLVAMLFLIWAGYLAGMLWRAIGHFRQGRTSLGAGLLLLSILYAGISIVLNGLAALLVCAMIWACAVVGPAVRRLQASPENQSQESV